MKGLCLSVGIALSVAMEGCAIHPLPENVTPLATYDIVKQIRCETRQAVINSALVYLTKGDKVDAKSRSVGRYFSENPDRIAQLKPELLSGNAKEFLSIFWRTGVAYTYTLAMTESNNIDADANLLKPISKRFGLGLKAGLDRQRQNTRTFTVTDNFDELVQKLTPTDCNGRLVGENYIYPITGRIGVEGMVHAFVYLSLFGNLGGKADNPGGPPTLVDALEFQTTISGSAAPKVTFSPAGDALSVADASLTAEVIRKDVHTVIIGLALDKGAVDELGKRRTPFAGQFVTATGNRAANAAAKANDQFISTTVFSPKIIIQQ